MQLNTNLKTYTTFGVNAHTKYFASFSSLEQLIFLLSEAEIKKCPHLILGQGSNLLFVNDFDGLVLKNELKGKKILQETEDKVYLKVAAGENWHDLVRYTLAQKWYGLENLSLIPGTVGAAPIQNIGAYGVEVKTYIDQVIYWDVIEKKIFALFAEDCQFAYRESVFKRELKNKAVILEVIFALDKIPQINRQYPDIDYYFQEKQVVQPTPELISEAICAIRMRKLPDYRILGNAGSFFKNPIIDLSQAEELKLQYPLIPFFPLDKTHVKVSAAWLIEQVGWKGKKINQVGVYTNQSLVLVNYGDARGREIFDLAQEIIKSIREKFAIDLTIEVNII